VKRTALARVSTETQAEDGLGLEVQRADMRAWAKAGGHKIVAWRTDEAISGAAELEDRLGLAEALDDVASGAAAGILVKRLDRLARDVILQETIIRDVRKMGGDVYSTSAAEADLLKDDPSDPSRKMIRVILGAVNEYERAMIALRLRSGRALKAQRGGFAYGSPGYGWTADKSAPAGLAPVEAEQRGLDRMRELRAAGESMASIAATLDAEGITPKRGGSWHKMTVKRALDAAEVTR
jgi:DNA invertase Pin-like site-specific DNA recombinase